MRQSTDLDVTTCPSLVVQRPISRVYSQDDGVACLRSGGGGLVPQATLPILRPLFLVHSVLACRKPVASGSVPYYGKMARMCWTDG